MKQITLFALLLTISIPVFAQHTFSIVAVDTLTGEVGSAGASCLDDIQFPGSGGAIIISDLLPGRGAIHTQAYWNAANQQNARLKMEEGLSPQQIIDWLKPNDVGGIFSSSTRQYGIVDFDPQGHARSAAFTGNSCMNWKGHKTGLNYSIQGNILLGPQILDSMEARFLNTGGPLADRLMAALQGANVIGADTRCTPNGTSSLSAFLRVARPGDTLGSLYLSLNVPSLPAGQEPIDSLQQLYNGWKLTAVNNAAQPVVTVFPNPAHDYLTILYNGVNGWVTVISTTGKVVWEERLSEGINRLYPALSPGMYFLKIQSTSGSSAYKKIIWQ